MRVQCNARMAAGEKSESREPRPSGACATKSESVRAVMARTKATAIALAFVLGAGGAGVAAFVACAPDLATFTLSPVPTPTSALCGNGFIDFDAGEQCDPGEGGAVGCTGKCAVECADGGFVDDASNHCYFAIATPVAYPNAKSGCVQASGHVVTFVSRAELSKVHAWNAAADASFWVGLEGQSAEGWVAVVDEPGWAKQCGGCYAENYDAGFFADFVDGATPPCVAVYSRSPSPWLVYFCGATLPTVCEREPLGTTAQPCNGGTCIDVLATLGKKRYLYVASDTDPAAAAAFCKQLPEGNLVVFESREEREQLWHELGQLPNVNAGVWIGLSRPDPDAGFSEWRWDTGERVADNVHPNPFGNNQPSRITGASLRAYAVDPGTVDSQLARNVDRGFNTSPATLPYLCQFKP